jgi:hypothetical protein
LDYPANHLQVVALVVVVKMLVLLAQMADQA